jgi:hypothetical protein
MKFDGHMREVSTFPNTKALNELQIAIKKYDWVTDPQVGNRGKDPAFNDSHVIQFTPSQLMCHIRPTFKQKYTESTLEIIKLGDIITSEIHQLLPDHYHLKSHFVSIIPYGKQIRHRDGEYYHDYAKRLVLPIITTEMSQTNFDDIVYHLEVGTVYEMNNRIHHWSENNDASNRTFLFADFIPPENLQIVQRHYNFTQV